MENWRKGLSCARFVPTLHKKKCESSGGHDVEELLDHKEAGWLGGQERGGFSSIIGTLDAIGRLV